MDRTMRYRRSRAGFTLVELLVAMAIIAILAALLIAFFPSLATQNDEANAAASLQNWFNIARQRANRYQNPYGVRLWLSGSASPNNPSYTGVQLLQVTDCQYIEQPDDFTGGIATVVGTSPKTVSLSGVDPTGGFNDATLYPVTPGTDFLEFGGAGIMHMITSVGTGGFQLNTPIACNPNATISTGNYRVLRGARPIGEEMMSFPNGVVVDLWTNANFGDLLGPYPLPTSSGGAMGGYVDVLFSPSGSVISPGLTTPWLAFWVRALDPADQGKAAGQQNIYYGTPSLIVVFTNTGRAGAYAPTPGNPYIDIH